MATALQILSVAAMKDQLDIGSVPTDDAFDAQIVNYIGGAVTMIDSLVRPDLLDRTEVTTIPQPLIEVPILSLIHI